MGKAIIISHAGKGQYTVDLMYDAAYLQRLIDRCNADYTQLQFNDYIKALDAKNAEYGRIQDAAADVDVAILAFDLDPSEDNRKEVERLTLIALKQSEAWETAVISYEFVRSRMDALSRRIATLQANQRERKRSALWCVDLADGKKDRKLFKPGDEVGTIEVSGQEELGQNLLASYADGWQYDAPSDGRMMNIAGMTHFEVFYNLGILPGWQKWRHKYRTGEITGGNPTDGWTVLLDDLNSSEQHIRVNTIKDGGRELTAVHAKYMSCDDLAFGVKDKVVLVVTIGGSPTATGIDALIIGFVEKPRPCLTSGFGYYALMVNAPNTQEWQHLNDETGPWLLRHPYATDLTAHAFDNGSDPAVRSWIGNDVDNYAPVLEFIVNGSAIYQSGHKLSDIPTDQSWRILGAALSPKGKFLYAVLYVSGTSVWLARKALAVDESSPTVNQQPRTVLLSGYGIVEVSANGAAAINDDKLLSGQGVVEVVAHGALSVVHAWEMQEIPLGAYALNVRSNFHFNSSCTRALSMWDYTHGAKRSPQSTPGGGAAWSSNLSAYDNTWKEKLEISLDAPDAKTLTGVGAAFTNHGRQGWLVYSYSDVDDISELSGGVQTRTTNSDYSWSGSYQVDTGFVGDDESQVYYQGQGSGSHRSSSNYGTPDDTSEFTIVDDLGIYCSVPLFGFFYPKNVTVRSISSNFTNSSPADVSIAGGSFNHTNSNLSIHNATAGLLVIDSINWSWSGSVTYTHPPSLSWDSTETESYTNQGFLYSGSLVDSSSTYEETVYTNRQPGHFVLAEPPVELVPAHNETSFILDYTGFNTGLYSSLIPTQVYEGVHGARSASNKYMAAWKRGTEYKAFLTGGDPHALDTLTDPVIYRAIHAT